MNTVRMILAIITASILIFFATLGVISITPLGNPEPEAGPAHTELEWAYETCRYGGAMFYLGRGIEESEALSLAVEGCNKSLADMGEDEFIWYNSPEGLEDLNE